ncbi:hypothetical protein [Granulicella sp. L60]|uniref:hypothetical protein n=1 Tax=Granulicella sp. L60 TaxID=1641866 RepID=UPI00131DBE42|nr:hypothetical protein [Granulicella sp. L60]
MSDAGSAKAVAAIGSCLSLAALRWGSQTTGLTWTISRRTHFLPMNCVLFWVVVVVSVSLMLLLMLRGRSNENQYGGEIIRVEGLEDSVVLNADFADALRGELQEKE